MRANVDFRDLENYFQRSGEYSVACARVRRVGKASRSSVKTTGPLALLAVLGFLLFAGLLSAAILLHDGMALLSVIMVSMSSTVVGIGAYTKIQFPEPDDGLQRDRPGDVIIRSSEGSFLVVKCPLDVANELFFEPRFRYHSWVSIPGYRALTSVGSLMLLFGLVVAINAKAEFQMLLILAYGASIFNLLIANMLPARIHWVLSDYLVEWDECKVLGSDEDSHGRISTVTIQNGTSTRALWIAIALSKRAAWATRSQAVPRDVDSWEAWLHEALEASRGLERAENPENGKTVWVIPDWDAQKAMGQIMMDLKTQKNV